MKRLTERKRNADGSGISTKSLVVESGMKKGFPSGYCGRIVTKLADYEDLEERGLLLRLPCKVEDTVYELCKCDDGIFRIFPMIVKSVAPYGAPILSKDKMRTVWNLYAESDYTKMYKSFYDFGKTVFLTHEEAEAALEKMN